MLLFICMLLSAFSSGNVSRIQSGYHSSLPFQNQQLDGNSPLEKYYRIYNSGFMSKTPEDYRNIVKILKLKLIKLREENSDICRRVGQLDHTAHSTYSDKITAYRTQQSTVANNCLLFLQLADRCELFGVTPEMLFRIADTQRTRKVSVQDFSNTLKKLALRLDEAVVVRLCTFLNTKKDGYIYYDDYMSLINAYQVQGQKYPSSGKSFTQLSVSKFANQLASQSVDQVFDKISGKNKGSSVTFQQFLSYGQANLAKMKQSELIAVFMSLTTDETLEVKRSHFNNELSRYHRQPKEDSYRQQEVSREKKGEIQKKSSIKSPQKAKGSTNNIVTKPSVKPKKDDGEFQDSEMTADQGKKKVEVKKVSSEIADSINILRANGLTLETLLNKVLDTSQEKKETKSFGFPHIYSSAVDISKKTKRSQLLKVFKVMDSSHKGSLCSLSLIRYWLQAKDRNDGLTVLLKLLRREIKMRRSDDAKQYFNSRNVKMGSPFNEEQFKKAFPDFSVTKEELQELGSLLGMFKGQELTKKINEVGKSLQEATQVDFKRLQSSKMEVFAKLVKPLLPKQDCRYPKHNRGLKQSEYWNSIFTNQWSCWNYCLETAKTLSNSWRDSEFGPIDGDKHGYNSIIANANDRVDWRLPEEEYTWISHREVLKQNQSAGKVQFFNDDISTNNVVQGQIGNCWFVSALSIISQYPNLLKGEELGSINQSNIQDCLRGVVPTLYGGFRQYGIYVFKFFKEGSPVFVVVDDRLPSQIQSKRFMFGRTPIEKMGVQWVSLVQKAYAKLHNTYSALFSGDIAQGLRDLTNCLSVRQIIPTKDEERQNLWSMLSDFKLRKTLMGCSIATPPKMAVQGAAKLDGQNTGLFYGHAYSISDVFSIKNPKPTSDEQKIFSLMRVRNPWGHGQYTLDWSEKDKASQDYDADEDKLRKYWKQIQTYYKDEEKKAKTNRQEGVELYTQADDGIFLMSFHDWSLIYTSIFLGLNLPAQWGGSFTKDAWSTKYPSMTISTSKATEDQKKLFANKNLQYRVELKDQTQILCILQQTDGRLYRGQVYPFKGIWNQTVIMAFKIKDKDSKLQAFDKSSMMTDSLKLQARRQVTLMKKFPKGTYILMPITKAFEDGNFDDKFPNFQMQIYYRCEKDRIKLSRAHDGKNFEQRSRAPLALSEGSDPKAVLSLIQKVKEVGI